MLLLWAKPSTTKMNAETRVFVEIKNILKAKSGLYF